MPPEGLIIELVTPLTPAGDLDASSLSRLVDRTAVVADGLLVGGPEAGEGLALPDEVRIDLIAQTLTLVKGRLPIFWGITGSIPEETRDLTLALRRVMDRQNYAGQVFLADLPLWYHSNRGLPQFYQELLEETGLPLILLNLPETVNQRAYLWWPGPPLPFSRPMNHASSPAPELGGWCPGEPNFIRRPGSG
ncbi:MAG: dihydrodipicolinate synthase family protein [Syntrophobacterales bacterium]